MSRNRRNTGFRGKKRQRGGKKIQKVIKIMKDFESAKKKIIRKIKNGAVKVKNLKKQQFGGLVQPDVDTYQQFGGRMSPKKYYLQ